MTASDLDLKVLIPDQPIDPGGGAPTLKFVVRGFSVVRTGLKVASAVHDALTLTQRMRLAEQLAEDSRIAKALAPAGNFLFALDAVNVLTTYIGFWLQLGGAHAAAMANIQQDNLLRGLSQGIVLGGDDVATTFVQYHFWQFGTLHYPFYPELDIPARNLHNLGLVSGYVQGKKLTRNQKGRLFSDIIGRMSDPTRRFYFGPDETFAEFKELGTRGRIDYYTDCAAIFRRAHLI